MKNVLIFLAIMIMLQCIQGCLKGSRKFLFEVKDKSVWYLKVGNDNKGASLNAAEFRLQKGKKFEIVEGKEILTEEKKYIFPLLIDKNRYLYLRMRASEASSRRKINRNIDCELVSTDADGNTDILTVLPVYNNYILKSRKSSSLTMVDEDKVIFPFISLVKGKHKLNLLMIHRTMPYKILKNESIDSFDADLFTPFFSWNDSRNIVFYSRPVGKKVSIAGYDLRTKKVKIYENTSGVICPVFYNGDLYGIKNTAENGSVIKYKDLKKSSIILKNDQKIHPPFFINDSYLSFLSSDSDSRLSWLTGTVVLNIARKDSGSYSLGKRLSIKSSGVIFKEDSVYSISGQGIYFVYDVLKDSVVYLPQTFEELTTLSDVFEIEDDYENVLKTLRHAEKLILEDPDLDTGGDLRIENLKDIARVYEEIGKYSKAAEYYSRIIRFYFEFSRENYSLRKKYGEEIYYLIMKKLDCLKNDAKEKQDQKYYRDYIESLLTGIELKNSEFIYLTAITCGRLLNDHFKEINALKVKAHGEYLRKLLDINKGKSKAGDIFVKLLGYTVEHGYIFSRLDEAYWLLGNIYQKRGKNSQAEDIFRTLNDRFPDSPYIMIDEE